MHYLQLCIFRPLLMYESSQLHLEPDWPLTLSSHLFQHVPSMAKLWRELMINLPSNISFCWQFSSTFISTTVHFQGNVEIDETRWNNYTQSAQIYHILNILYFSIFSCKNVHYLPLFERNRLSYDSTPRMKGNFWMNRCSNRPNYYKITISFLRIFSRRGKQNS